MRTVLILIVLAATGHDAGPPTKPLDEHYTAVRKDVLAQLNTSDLNLPICEQGLERAQTDLEAAQKNIADMRAAAEELQRQKRVLEDHVTKLEALLAYYESQNTVATTLVRGWEQVDAPIACAACWALGTSQCMGLAYIFNRPEFRSE